jgi:hypothetical protein
MPRPVRERGRRVDSERWLTVRSIREELPVRTNAFHRHLSVIQTLSLIGAVSASVSASAGASVKGEWVDKALRGKPFSRILVVGISPNVDQRCPFERNLASRLKSESTVAMASCDVVAEKNPLTRESIEGAVKAQNADAVIATSLISKDWDVKQGNTYDTRGSAQYKATDAYYGYYGTVVAADFQASAPLTTLNGQAHIVSKVYETQGATVVYTIDTKVTNVASTEAGLIEITLPIGKRLRKDGLIR